MPCIGGVAPCTGLEDGSGHLGGTVLDENLEEIILDPIDMDAEGFLMSWTGGEAFTRMMIIGPHPQEVNLLSSEHDYADGSWEVNNARIEYRFGMIPDTNDTYHRIFQLIEALPAGRYKYEFKYKKGYRIRARIGFQEVPYAHQHIWLEDHAIAWRDVDVLNEQSSGPGADGYYTYSCEFILAADGDFYVIAHGIPDTAWTFDYAGDDTNIDFYLKNNKVTRMDDPAPVIITGLFDGFNIPFDTAGPISLGKGMINGERYRIYYRTETLTHHSLWQEAHPYFTGTDYVYIVDGIDDIIDGTVPDFIIDD